MDLDRRPNLLTLADQFGEPFEAAMASDEATHQRSSDGPMTEEQASYLGYLTRRLGRLPDEEPLTFAEAKVKITELLIRLSNAR
jgi:hypothetical protein